MHYWTNIICSSVVVCLNKETKDNTGVFICDQVWEVGFIFKSSTYLVKNRLICAQLGNLLWSTV